MIYSLQKLKLHLSPQPLNPAHLTFYPTCWVTSSVCERYGQASKGTEDMTLPLARKASVPSLARATCDPSFQPTRSSDSDATLVFRDAQVRKWLSDGACRFVTTPITVLAE